MSYPQATVDAGTAGALFVFEGPDDVGKTTLAAEVQRVLATTSSRSVALHSFPGRIPGTLGAHVYELHHDAGHFAIGSISPTSLQMLHVAAHIDTIETRLRPAVEARSIVLLDRFWWSTWVFGVVAGANRDALTMMIELERKYWEALPPTAIFLVSRSLEAGSRAQSTAKRVQAEYASLAAREASRTRVIPVQNDGPVEAARDLIVESIRRLLSVSRAAPNS